MENSINFNQSEGLQIVQGVPDSGQSLLPQLKKFTMFSFSGGLGDTCLLYFVGLRSCALQHILLHCVKGSRGATPGIQSSIRRYFSTRSPHAILQFSECSSYKTCPRHLELGMQKSYDWIMVVQFSCCCDKLLTLSFFFISRMYRTHVLSTYHSFFLLVSETCRSGSNNLANWTADFIWKKTVHFIIVLWPL